MAHIQFYYPKRLAFSPADFENPGLGGGESSIVLLSKSLANHGHYVEVFCACWNPGIYDGVVWRGAWEIYDSDIPDIMIHVRTKSSIIDRRAKQNIFWMLDDRADGAIYFSKKYPNQQVIVASDAMVRKLKNAGFVGKYTLINFPIETNRFENAPLPSASRLCLHTSMPNRGLLQLINLWPHVKKMVPDAQLIATSGWELWGYTHEEATDRLRQTLGHNFDDSGVKLAGVLPRQDLINLIKTSRIGIFPSSFPEMYCLSAAEFAVAGKPIIVSDIEALSERVIDKKTGYCISGDICSEKVQMEFVHKIVRLLNDDRVVDEMGAAAKKQASMVSCDFVVSQWERLFDN